MNHENTDPTPKMTNWLQRLKDESWEAELLVSVASIFAIFKGFQLLDWLVDYFIDVLVPEQYFYGYMICFLGYIAFGILGSFFVIHFGLRAYWIGLVGLNSVFPDYSIEDSAYSKVYTEKMSEKLPKLPKTIDSLDEICSVIFSAAFTLLLIYLYGGVLSSVYLLLFNLLKEQVPIIVLLVPAILFGFMYFVVTLFSLIANIKKFKGNAKLQTWYFHIMIWGSKVFYGPLYKYSLQTTMVFGSNFKKKKALVKSVLFMLVFGLTLGTYQIFQSNVMYLLSATKKNDISRTYSSYYAKNNQEVNFLMVPEIQEEISNKAALHIFVPILDHESAVMAKDCDIPKIEFLKNTDALRQKRWSANLSCYASNVTVILNDEVMAVDFLKTDHHRTNQFGITGFVNLKNTSSGLQKLKIIKTVSQDLEKEWEIPFFYAPD